MNQELRPGAPPGNITTTIRQVVREIKPHSGLTLPKLAVRIKRALRKLDEFEDVIWQFFRLALRVVALLVVVVFVFTLLRLHTGDIFAAFSATPPHSSAHQQNLPAAGTPKPAAVEQTTEP